LGYRSITLPIETFRQDAPAIVRLKPEAFLLQAVDVKPVSARALVQEAIARMAENYDAGPHLHPGFFRESIRDQDGYLSVAEGLFEAAFFPEERKKEQLQLRLIKGRLSEDVRSTRLFEDFHPAGSPHRLAGLSLSIHRPAYLQEKYMDRYEYWLDSIIHSDGKALYIVSFDQRPSVKEALSKGRLFIDKESRAIVRMEAGISPRGMPYVDHLSGKDKLFAKLLNIEFLIRRSDLIAEFEKFDGKWYLNNATFHHNITYRQPKKRLGLNLEIYEELLITGLKKEGIQPFSRPEQWDRKQLMLSLPAEYNEAFWGDNNHILPSRALHDIVDSMAREPGAGISATDTLSGGWVLLNSGQAKAYRSGGSIFLKPYMESEWMDEQTGPMLKREKRGDFVFEALVEVQKASDTTQAPDKGFQQGGILVRNPESGHENYLMIGLGAGGNPNLKVGGNFTRNGKSSLKTDKPNLNRLRLRIRRQGQQFRLSYQIPGTAQWTLLREEELPGFPETAELGLVGYTHFPGNAPAMRPDLLVKFSEINIR
ncbi:MAG: DUF1349 domain-containing protein, partial [Phaeodactylibacter sp.]|nr:DUF1349 domain-containing protein [Phaeodactylibacter sp.]